ncbi:MAG: hypothetical protein QXX95_07100 [Nitrososphaerales archaeon]
MVKILKSGMSELALESSLVKVKAKVKKEFKIDLPSLDFKEVKENEVIEVPLWAAQILAEKSFIEDEKEDFFLEIQKALITERLQPRTQLAELRKDFFVKARIFIEALKRYNKYMEAERSLSSLFDLFSLRLSKLLQLASSLALPSNIDERLTKEEKEFMLKVRSVIEDWRKEILEVKV